MIISSVNIINNSNVNIARIAVSTKMILKVEIDFIRHKCIVRIVERSQLQFILPSNDANHESVLGDWDASDRRDIAGCVVWRRNAEWGSEIV